MNLQLAVVGAPKTGKTSLCINFAEYLGATNLCYTENGLLGRGRGVISVRQARKLMVHPGSRSNGVMRSFAVNLPGDSLRRVVLVDTVSLKEQKPLPRRERPKLLLTLQALQEADAVLYLIDLSCSDPVLLHFAMEAGIRLMKYCRNAAKPFITLGTKCDLLPAAGGFSADPIFPGGKVIPVSSLDRRGFAELRKLLLAEEGMELPIRMHSGI